MTGRTVVKLAGVILILVVAAAVAIGSYFVGYWQGYRDASATIPAAPAAFPEETTLQADTCTMDVEAPTAPAP